MRRKPLESPETLYWKAVDVTYDGKD